MGRWNIEAAITGGDLPLANPIDACEVSRMSKGRGAARANAGP